MNSTYQTSATVHPVWFRKDDPATYQHQLALEIQVSLKATQAWITCPEFIALNNGGKSISINVDCASLTPGFHFGQVQAFDSSNLNSGPLFSIPVTVCKPEPMDLERSSLKWSSLEFKSGEIVRKFVQVPMHANFAGIIILHIL